MNDLKEKLMELRKKVKELFLLIQGYYRYLYSEEVILIGILGILILIDLSVESGPVAFLLFIAFLILAGFYWALVFNNLSTFFQKSLILRHPWMGLVYPLMFYLPINAELWPFSDSRNFFFSQVLKLLSPWLLTLVFVKFDERVLLRELLKRRNTTHEPVRQTLKKVTEEMRSTDERIEKEVKDRIKSEHLRTELITNISHDIKTPLTSILNFTELLSQTSLDAQGKDYLAVVEKSAHRMKNLVNDLFTATKSATGNIEMELTLVDFSELVMQTYAPLDSRFEEKNIRMVYNNRDKNLWLLADGSQLSRVIQNLLVNAVNYGMPGTRLYINGREFQDRAQITFTNVSENELNISPNELMEQFVRGDSSRRTEGSGLGLYIAQNLLKNMGGRLSLSIEGDLFQATIELPLAKVESEETLGLKQDSQASTGFFKESKVHADFRDENIQETKIMPSFEEPLTPLAMPSQKIKNEKTRGRKTLNLLFTLVIFVLLLLIALLGIVN